MFTRTNYIWYLTKWTFDNPACEKILPLALGGVLLFVILFVLYVRSVPPKAKPATNTTPSSKQAVPDFMNINVDPRLSGAEAEQAALDEAMRQPKGRRPGGETGI